jgi:hypothetical protein
MTTIKQLDVIDPEALTPILNHLINNPIPINKYRKRVGEGRSQCFGIVGKRSMAPDLSRLSWLDAKLHFLLMEFGKKYVPIPFTSIQVNMNMPCKPHRDSNNSGLSYLIAFGDFPEGGRINISNQEYFVKYRPLLFDGSKEEHYVTNWRGNRFSLVYHTIAETHWGAIKPLSDYEAIEQNGKWVIRCKDGTILSKARGLPHPLQKKSPLQV